MTENSGPTGTSPRAGPTSFIIVPARWACDTRPEQLKVRYLPAKSMAAIP